jgi:hypothetical protein
MFAQMSALISMFFGHPAGGTEDAGNHRLCPWRELLCPRRYCSGCAACLETGDGPSLHGLTAREARKKRASPLTRPSIGDSAVAGRVDDGG